MMPDCADTSQCTNRPVTSFVTDIWIYLNRPDVTCVIIPCNKHVNSRVMHIMTDTLGAWGQTNTPPVGFYNHDS